MTALPEKLRDLQLAVHGQTQALLTKQSIYSLVYEAQARHQVGLGLPIADRVFQDGDLFAALDMNLPEGYLFERILARFGKFQVSKMHLLALMGAGAIGRVAYQMPGEAPLGAGAAGLVSRDDLLAGGRSEALFEELVDAFMGPGTGLAGVQPKIMVPVADKASSTESRVDTSTRKKTSRPRLSVPAQWAAEDPCRIWLVSSASARSLHSSGATSASSATTVSSAAALAPTGVRRAPVHALRATSAPGSLSADRAPPGRCRRPG